MELKIFNNTFKKNDHTILQSKWRIVSKESPYLSEPILKHNITTILQQ